MTATNIVNVRLSDIDPNPMRKLKRYPYDEKKLEALQASINGVGLWPGIIARKHGRRYQIAFGHHRVEAAKREAKAQRKTQDQYRIPLIIMDLSDEEMLQYMGRENLEDYNANFLVMLESWEAAHDFFARGHVQIPEAIEVATLLGWVRPHPSRKDLLLAPVAEACNAAHHLIAGGFKRREQFDGMSVDTVRRICQTEVAMHMHVERNAAKSKATPREIQTAKRDISRLTSKTVGEVKSGKVAPSGVRNELNREISAGLKQTKATAPLFAKFGRDLANRIGNMLRNDNTASQLKEVRKSLSHLEDGEDKAIVKRLAFECGELSERADKWHTTFENHERKVTHLRSVKR